MLAGPRDIWRQTNPLCHCVVVQLLDVRGTPNISQCELRCGPLASTLDVRPDGSSDRAELKLHCAASAVDLTFSRDIRGWFGSWKQRAVGRVKLQLDDEWSAPHAHEAWLPLRGGAVSDAPCDVRLMVQCFPPCDTEDVVTRELLFAHYASCGQAGTSTTSDGCADADSGDGGGSASGDNGISFRSFELLLADVRAAIATRSGDTAGVAGGAGRAPVESRHIAARTCTSRCLAYCGLFRPTESMLGCGHFRCHARVLFYQAPPRVAGMCDTITPCSGSCVAGRASSTSPCSTGWRSCSSRCASTWRWSSPSRQPTARWWCSTARRWRRRRKGATHCRSPSGRRRRCGARCAERLTT